MESPTLLEEISSFCRQVGMAESTFGRLAINDGKLMSRLRTGGRVTPETAARVRAYISTNPSLTRRRAPPAPAPHPYAPKPNGLSSHALMTNGAAPPRSAQQPAPAEPRGDSGEGVDKNFRFYDNRQKYLLFVNTCSEKFMVADRVAQELPNLHPTPPALRVFDAGVGDGTVLTSVMRSMHHRYPTMPFHIVGKEISLEDVRLALEKMPDRFCEHPATVLVMTNMNYAEAPWLTPESVTAASSMVWHEVALTGDTSHDFERQIAELQPFLSENWRAQVSQHSGNPVYEKPVVLVIYREDRKFMLDQVRPRRGTTSADFDLVIASQPYRARASVDFKAKRVIAPLARALGPGGRLIGIHSHGNDPAMEIVRKIWPNENPFTTDRHQLLRAVKTELGKDARGINFNAYADARALFRYEMHTLPHEISESIGSSPLLAAWNAAIYVAQIEDHRLAEVMTTERYLDATREVLQAHGGLWFWDETFVISRRQELR